jgi:hypothetical protein
MKASNKPPPPPHVRDPENLTKAERQALLVRQRKFMLWHFERKDPRMASAWKRLNAYHALRLRRLSQEIRRPGHPRRKKPEPDAFTEISKRLLEGTLPHIGRRGSSKLAGQTGRKGTPFSRGRDAGFFVRGLERDLEHEAANSHPNAAYLRALEEDIRQCHGEFRQELDRAKGRARHDLERGFRAGMSFGDRDALDVNTSTVILKLWTRLPEILADCLSIPDLFQRIYQRPTRTYQGLDKAFRAFEKFCQRIKLRVRSPGRPKPLETKP